MSGVLALEPVGFVGLGQMGLPMANNLLRAGHRVIAWSREAKERDAFVALGGAVVDRIADLEACPLVMSIVFDDAAVRAITLDEGGLLQTLQAGAIHVAMETISPTLAREVSGAYTERGIRHLTAPVFGPPHVAQAADLKFNCSGPKAVYDAVEPILTQLGKPFLFGERPEQGLMVKIMGNNMIFTIIELMHECFTLLSAAGLEADSIRSMLIDRLFQSPIMNGYAQFFVDNPGALPPFNANPIPRKDNGLCIELARELNIAVPLIEVVKARMDGLS